VPNEVVIRKSVRTFKLGKNNGDLVASGPTSWPVFKKGSPCKKGKGWAVGGMLLADNPGRDKEGGVKMGADQKKKKKKGGTKGKREKGGGR